MIIDKEEELFERDDYVFIRDVLELYGEMLIKRKKKSDFELDLMLNISGALNRVENILLKLDDYLDEYKLDN